MIRSLILVFLSFTFVTACSTTGKEPKRTPLVLTTDFGLRDGAVSAMKGVAYQVDSELFISDLSHEIAPYDIWEAAYRVEQTFRFWPAGTVFVTVVDPGVGSKRKSLVARAKTGQVFVGPDNGWLTLIEDEVGLTSVREINEKQARRAGSEESYTFHGRDLYAFVGAQIAAGQLKPESIGIPLEKPVRFEYQKPILNTGELHGTLTVLDPNYGNIWTNIPKTLLNESFSARGKLHVTITQGKKQVFAGWLPVANTFNDVPKKQPLLYYNSLMNLSLALNQDNFAAKYKIAAGADWRVRVRAD